MNNYVLTVFSKKYFARASILISALDSKTAEQNAIKLFKNGLVTNWYLEGYQLQDEIISKVHVSRVDRIAENQYSVLLVTDSIPAYAFKEIASLNEINAAEEFKKVDLKNSWIWNNITLYDHEFPIYGQYVFDSSPKLSVEFQITPMMIPEVQSPYVINVTAVSLFNEIPISVKGEVRLNDGPRIALINNSASLTYIPKDAGSQDYSVSFYPGDDDLFTFLKSKKYFNVNVSKGNQNITISPNKTTISTNEWITINLIHDLEIPYTVEVTSLQGMTRRKLETRLVNQNPEIIMVKYNSSLSWDMNQSLKCEFNGNSNYNPVESNLITITIS